MPVTLLTEVPDLEGFTPRSHHESSTPQSFFEGPPVLYLSEQPCSIVATRAELDRCPDLRRWWSPSSILDYNGNSTVSLEGKTVKGQVGIIVSTEYVFGGLAAIIQADNIALSSLILLSSPEEPSNEPRQAVSITYPAIGLHAVQMIETHVSSRITDVIDRSAFARPLSAVYLQVDPWHAESNSPPADSNVSTDLRDPIEIYIVPHSVAQACGPEASQDLPPVQCKAAAIYDALSACADLWPDDDESENANEASRIDFGTDWITSEDLNNFQDAEDEVGQDGDDSSPFTGQRRRRAETDEHLNGESEQDELAKWRRTS